MHGDTAETGCRLSRRREVAEVVKHRLQARIAPGIRKLNGLVTSKSRRHMMLRVGRPVSVERRHARVGRCGVRCGWAIASRRPSGH